MLRSFRLRTPESPALRRCSSSQKISAKALIFREPLCASFFSMEKRSQKPSKGGTPFDNPRRPWFRQLQLTRIYHWPSCVRPAREHAIYRASPSNAETEPEDFTRWYTSAVCCPASQQTSRTTLRFAGALRYPQALAELSAIPAKEQAQNALDNQHLAQGGYQRGCPPLMAFGFFSP